MKRNLLAAALLGLVFAAPAVAQPAATRPAVDVPEGGELIEPKQDAPYAPAGEPMRVEEWTVDAEGLTPLDLLVAVPADYDADPEKAWPLVVFLHGAGERGDDVQKVAAWGPPKLIKEGAAIPAIVVSPQCPAESWWPREVESLSHLLDQVEARYRVDADRVYLTGLSMGGFGSVAWATAEPEKFAAVVAVCGGGDPAAAQAMASIPTWFLHGVDDDVVPYANSVALYNALREADGADDADDADVKLTLYEGVDHFSWIPAYADAAVWEWMFGQSLSDAPDRP